MCHNDFNKALGIQHRNLSIAIVLIYLHVAYVDLIGTGFVFDIWAPGNHIDVMMAVFNQISIMNWLYWHNQQEGYLCFIPFVWEQRGVLAAVADQIAMILHL